MKRFLPFLIYIRMLAALSLAIMALMVLTYLVIKGMGELKPANYLKLTVLISIPLSLFLLCSFLISKLQNTSK